MTLFFFDNDCRFSFVPFESYLDRVDSDSSQESVHATKLDGSIFPSVQVLMKFLDGVTYDFNHCSNDSVVESFCRGDPCPDVAGKFLDIASVILPSIYSSLYVGYVRERNTYWSSLFGHPDSFELLFCRAFPFNLDYDRYSRGSVCWMDLRSMYLVLWIFLNKFKSKPVVFVELSKLYCDKLVRVEFADFCVSEVFMSGYYPIDIPVSLLGLFAIDGYLYIVDGCDADGIHLGDWFMTENNAHSSFESPAIIAGYNVDLVECDSGCSFCRVDFVDYCRCVISGSKPSYGAAESALLVLSHVVDNYPYILKNNPSDVYVLPSINDVLSAPLFFSKFTKVPRGPDVVFDWLMWHEWNRRRDLKPGIALFNSRWLTGCGQYLWVSLCGHRPYPFYWLPRELNFKIFSSAFPNYWIYEGQFRDLHGFNDQIT